MLNLNLFLFSFNSTLKEHMSLHMYNYWFEPEIYSGLNSEAKH